MANSRVQRFADALRAYEQDGDLDRFIECFDEGCEISNVASPRTFQGKDGAREFWREYRGTLTDVRSEFRNLIEAQDRAALEWETEGTAATGAHIRYEGTSVLEFEGDKVKRFYAYFDPHRLGLALTRGTGKIGGPAKQEERAESLRGQSTVEGP